MIFNFSRKSRVTEVDAGTSRIIGAYQNTGLSSDPHLVTIFTVLIALLASLTAAIRRTKTESDLEEKDEVRDDKIRALYYMVLGFLHHPDAAIKAAAQMVEKVFDKYGLAITGESYATESSLISSLLDDLSKPKLQEAISLLSGLAIIVSELDAAQSDFEQARIAYEQEKAHEGTEENATKLKAEVLNQINGKLVIYMRAMEQVDEATYGAFARTVAEIINDNNEVVKKRSKKPEPTE